MRRWMCVPMISLCLLASACGMGKDAPDAAEYRALYHEMAGCTMAAVVSCGQGEQLWSAKLWCEYVPEGRSTVEVLEPETIAGVRAVLEGEELRLEYEDLCLNAGPLSSQELSPAACLPRVMSALRDGWQLEESFETWNNTDCLRLTMDQSGVRDGKILSTVWLRQEDGLPLRAEIAVDGEIILTAEFTDFRFCDTIAAS